MESVNQRLGNNLKPSNIVDEFLSINLLLNTVKVLNLFVEFGEIGLSCCDAIKDLVVHEIKFIHSFLHVVLIVFFVFTNMDSMHLLSKDFLKIFTTFKEFLERLFEVFFPEEVPLSELIKEGRSLASDLVHVVLDVLEASKQTELILDFNKVISSTTILVIKARNLDSNRDEVTDDFINNISNTVVLIVALEAGNEIQISINKVDLDLEDRSPHVIYVSLNVDLFGEVLHRCANSHSDSLNEKAIAEVNVSEPVSSLFVGFDVIKRVSE